MFTYEDKQKALRIVSEIMQHPISGFFVDSSDEKSLYSLSQKIQNNTISSLNQLQHEIDAALSNAEQIYQDDEYFRIAALYIKQTFRKKLEKNFTKSIGLWSRRVAHLERKLEKLNMENPIEAKYPKLGFSYDQKLGSQLLNERDYNQFNKAIAMIKDQGELEELYNIVESMQPELTVGGTVTRIPILKLKSATLKTLIRKLKEMFKAKEIVFPS